MTQEHKKVKKKKKIMSVTNKTWFINMLAIS